MNSCFEYSVKGPKDLTCLELLRGCSSETAHPEYLLAWAPPPTKHLGNLVRAALDGAIGQEGKARGKVALISFTSVSCHTTPGLSASFRNRFWSVSASGELVSISVSKSRLSKPTKHQTAEHPVDRSIAPSGAFPRRCTKNTSEGARAWQRQRLDPYEFTSRKKTWQQSARQRDRMV